MTSDWTVWGAALIVIVSIVTSLWLVVVADIVRRWWREVPLLALIVIVSIVTSLWLVVVADIVRRWWREVPLSWWLDRQARQRRKAIAAIEQLMEDERQKLRRVAEWKRR